MEVIVDDECKHGVNKEVLMIKIVVLYVEHLNNLLKVVNFDFLVKKNLVLNLLEFEIKHEKLEVQNILELVFREIKN